MYNVDKILKLIEQSKIPKKEIAEKTNLSPSIFAEWKKGKCKPSDKAVIKIADFLNVPISDFYIYGNDETAGKIKNLVAKVKLMQNELNIVRNMLEEMLSTAELIKNGDLQYEESDERIDQK